MSQQVYKFNGKAVEMMAGKPVLYREAKTVLNLNSLEFQEKNLCDGIVLNPGDSCVYTCAFCYSSAIMLKLDYLLVKDFNKENNLDFDLMDIVFRRGKAVAVAESQIVKQGSSVFNDPSDRRVVFSSSLVDVAANMDLLRETAELVNLILDQTFWQVRLLSKSSLLHLLVKKGLIPNKRKDGSKFTHHERIIFGFSTGTFHDGIAKAFEKGTSLVSKRIEALHWLQDNGFRTFGMICPSLPQDNYDTFSKAMCQAIRVERCEHVWAEVINVRGKSYARTKDALSAGGYKNEVSLLAPVSDESKQRQQNWEQYARATFEAHKKHIPADKLRFLQYIDSISAGYWGPERANGAVLLGKGAKALGMCSIGSKSAPAHYYEERC